MAPEAEPRNYHSVAILLPDGTVFSGGGGLCGDCATNHSDGQIFTPPYLLNANGTLRTRPTITSAPTSAATGRTITVTTAARCHFSMVRYGESTHSVDNDQRRIPLPILAPAGTPTTGHPGGPGHRPPGPYMLFALDRMAHLACPTTISITNVATPLPSTPTASRLQRRARHLLAPQRRSRDDGGRSRAATATPASTRTAGSPTRCPQPGGEHIGQRGDPERVQRPDRGLPAPAPPPTTYSEDMWFKTTTSDGGLLSASAPRPAAPRPVETGWSSCPTAASSPSGSTPARPR